MFKSHGDFSIYRCGQHMTTIVIDVLANEVDATRGFYNDVGL